MSAPGVCKLKQKESDIRDYHEKVHHFQHHHLQTKKS